MPDGFSFDNSGTDAAGNSYSSVNNPPVDPGILAYVGKLLNGFGSGVQSGFSNPGMLPVLGMAQGAGVASTPSRMPVTRGMVFGDLAGGWTQGMQAGQQAQLTTQQIQAAQIQNALNSMTLRGYGALQQQNGMAGPPTGAGAIAQSMTPPGGSGGGGYAPMGVPNMAPPGVNASQAGWYLRSANQPAMAAAGMSSAPSSAPAGSGSPGKGGASGSSATAPLFDVAAMARQYRILAATPGMQPVAAQVLKTLNDNMPVGAYMSQDGSINMRPGFENYQVAKSLAEKGLTQNPDGSFGVPAGEISGLTSIANTKPEAVRGEGTTLLQNGKPVWQNPTIVKSVDASGTPFQSFVYTGRGGSAAGGGAGSAGTAGTGAPSAGASAPGGTAGRYQTGLNPLQAASAEARGKQLEDYSAGLATNASNATNQNFLIDQLRQESGNGAGWVPGRFAEWGGEMRALFNGAGISTDASDAALANFQAFQKNAMALTTQATRQVSARAAVQEMQMIAKAMPNADTSAGGLNYIFNQLGANNDFQIAKQQASDTWRTGHSGTLDGFESNWNKGVSPYAFFVHRLDSGSLGTMINNLQGSTQGRALIAKMRSEVTFAQQNNLFNDGGQ